jgi:molybdopterin/thiamine biosynthesis adenylyltransferase
MWVVNFVTFFFLILFLHVHAKGRREIRTNNLHFMRCDHSELSYLLRTSYFSYNALRCNLIDIFDNMMEKIKIFTKGAYYRANYL